MDIYTEVIKLVSSLPYAERPQFIDLLERSANDDWHLPAISCAAVGGKIEWAILGCAAVACLKVSILLVDDIIDEDPRGVHNQIGAQAATNLSRAFHSAVMMLTAVNIPVKNCLNQAFFTTSTGQQFDARNVVGEEVYWQIVRLKSSPFYGAALAAGSILGGANSEMSQGLYKLGATLGEMVQVSDDLKDAMAVPANPDWLQGRNNLLFLYARITDHPDREQFLKLFPQVAVNARLREAQEILLHCGAVDYCIHLLKKYRQSAIGLVNDLNLANQQPLLGLFNRQNTLLERLLGRI